MAAAAVRARPEGRGNRLGMVVDGAERAEAVLPENDLKSLECLAGRWRAGAAGVRIREDERLDSLLAKDGVLHRLAVSKLGPAARPVRCVLFDKRADTNWALGWHQDRTIAVREKHDVHGF